MSVSGIVLAGGRSTRFGRDKLAEPIDGSSLLQRAVRGVSPVCAEILVVVAPEVPEPVLEPSPRVRVVRDRAEGEGPLAGLLAGLDAAREALAIVVGADMPDLRAPVLQEMARRGSTASPGAVVLADADGFRPLPCVLGAEVARAAARSVYDAGGRSLHALLDDLGVLIVPEVVWTELDPERATLRDVDRPQDLDPR